MKFKFIFFLLVLFSQNVLAQTIVGCYIGGGNQGIPDRVYYKQIGTVPAYNNLNYTVFSSSMAFSHDVNTDPNNLNKCGYINYTYNRQNMVLSGAQPSCLVNSSVSTNGAAYGAQVSSFTVNTSCSVNGLPLDDYNGYIIVFSAIIGVCFLRKNFYSGIC